jgi:hypothetical protein
MLQPERGLIRAQAVKFFLSFALIDMTTYVLKSLSKVLARQTMGNEVQIVPVMIDNYH